MNTSNLTMFLLCFLLLFSGCEKEAVEEEIPEVLMEGLKVERLEGVWVEEESRADTLFCDSYPGEDKVFFLGRGREIRYGHDLPLPGVSNYSYLIKPDTDTIALRAFISSNSGYNNYYFKMINTNKLKIGDFYMKNATSGGVVTFVKLEE